MWPNAAISSMQPQMLITVRQLQCHVAFGKPGSKLQNVAKSSKESELIVIPDMIKHSFETIPISIFIFAILDLGL